MEAFARGNRHLTTNLIVDVMQCDELSSSAARGQPEDPRRHPEADHHHHQQQGDLTVAAAREDPTAGLKGADLKQQQQRMFKAARASAYRILHKVGWNIIQSCVHVLSTYNCTFLRLPSQSYSLIFSFPKSPLKLSHRHLTYNFHHLSHHIPPPLLSQFILPGCCCLSSSGELPPHSGGHGDNRGRINTRLRWNLEVL